MARKKYTEQESKVLLKVIELLSHLKELEAEIEKVTTPSKTATKGTPAFPPTNGEIFTPYIVKEIKDIGKSLADSIDDDIINEATDLVGETDAYIDYEDRKDNQRTFDYVLCAIDEEIRKAVIKKLK